MVVATPRQAFKSNLEQKINRKCSQSKGAVETTTQTQRQKQFAPTTRKNEE